MSDDPFGALELVVERLEYAADRTFRVGNVAANSGGLDVRRAISLALRVKTACALALRGGCAVLGTVEREAAK